jgi:tetratricopeptide (TPR) repeat protein
MLFHEILGEALKERRMSLAALAAQVGRGERAVRYWASGERLPDDADFALLCRALGLDAPARAEARVALENALEAAREKKGRPGRKPAAAKGAPRTIPIPARCLGRDPELAALVAALLPPQGGTALILGDGGMGKTTLCRQAAHHQSVRDRFGPRRFEASLDTARNVADMQGAIATALGVDSAQSMPAILAHLRQAPALLLLDNLETPWEAETDAVETLLRELAQVPGLAICASIRGRQAPRWPDWGHQADLRPLNEEDSRRLFRRIAPRIRDDDPHLAPLLRELAGIPLAIELVARQAEPEEELIRIWQAWQATGTALAADERRGDHRHASLDRSIALSLASPRLGEPGRRLFRLLGDMPAGMAQAEQDALLGADAGTAARQLLVVGLAWPREGRLDLLPPIRRFATALHPPQAEERAAWVQHLLQVTADFEPDMWTRGANTINRLRPEIANLERAFEAAAGNAELRSTALAALWTYTTVCRFTGLGGQAIRALARTCANTGDRLGEANCIQRLAHIALARFDHDAARAGYAQAMPIYQEVGHRLGEASCIESLADIALARSDHDAARAGYAQAMPIYQEVGYRLGEANCIQGLADIALDRSDHDAARAGYAQAMHIHQEIGDKVGEAICLGWLGEVAAAQGNRDEARRLLGDAIAMFESVGSAGNVRWARGVMARLGL